MEIPISMYFLLFQKTYISNYCAFLAPNLQHWLGCSSWAKLCPNAEIYVAPEAEGECLLEKLGLQGSSRAKILNEKGTLFDGQLSYSLLKGTQKKLLLFAFFFLKILKMDVNFRSSIDVKRDRIFPHEIINAHCC